jgi:hypothetical protein
VFITVIVAIILSKLARSLTNGDAVVARELCQRQRPLKLTNLAWDRISQLVESSNKLKEARYSVTRCRVDTIRHNISIVSTLGSLDRGSQCRRPLTDATAEAIFS